MLDCLARGANFASHFPSATARVVNLRISSAEILESMGRLEDAAAVYYEAARNAERTLSRGGAITDLCPTAYHNAGLALKRLAQNDASEEAYTRAIALRASLTTASVGADGAATACLGLVGELDTSLTSLAKLLAQAFSCALDEHTAQEHFRVSLAIGGLLRCAGSVKFDFAVTNQLFGSTNLEQALLSKSRSRPKALAALTDAASAARCLLLGGDADVDGTAGVEAFRKQLCSHLDHKFASKLISTKKLVKHGSQTTQIAGLLVHNRTNGPRHIADHVRQQAKSQSPMHGKLIHLCSYCQKIGEELKLCPCKTVQYCSSECQKRHWKEAHKATCPLKNNKKEAHKGTPFS
jgi:hypothetical protein